MRPSRAVALLAILAASGALPAVAATPEARPRPTFERTPVPYLPALRGRAALLHGDEPPGGTPAEGGSHFKVVRELVISGAVIGAGFLLDDTFEPGSGEGTAVDDVGQFIGSPYTLAAGSGVMAVVGWSGHNDATVTTAKHLVYAIGASTLTVAGLKAVTQRERPNGQNNYSFPSGHAAASFAAATVLDRKYGGAVGWVAYGGAAFVAVSRVVGNHHYFSDVVAGAVIGHFFGRLFTSGK